jgi:deazaflavin-dependent oxidoreductase (nitroreductase family)
MSELHLWSDQQWRDRNDGVIPDFRAAGENTRPNLLILTTKGAKSGKPHVTPLIYLEDNGRLCVFASKGGNPKNPAWYHNLLANPNVQVELKGETFNARASIADPAERDRIYATQGAVAPNFLEYQSHTTRQIPVVILDRTS